MVRLRLGLPMLMLALSCVANAADAEEEKGEFAERAERAWKLEKEFQRRYGISRNEMFRRTMEIGMRERRGERERLRRALLAQVATDPPWVSLGPSFAPVSPTALGAQRTAPSDSALVNAIAIHPSDPRTIFVGPAGGGVWRSRDAGTTWTPLTDDVGTTAIGAIAIAPSNARRIYAGCGSGRQSLGAYPPGPGLLVSEDGGDTWKLGATSPGNEFWFVWVHPANEKTLLVGTDRGLHRSTDGGDSWVRTLDTGGAWATGIAQQPGNPSVLLVSGFRFGREVFQGGACVPGTFVSGRLWKSTDGGLTWSEKTGVPGGDPSLKRSRIEVVFAPSDPNVAYALISRSAVDANGCAAPATGNLGKLLDVARSADAGETWSARGVTAPLSGILETLLSQMDYDSVISVDPRDANVVWAGGIDLARSTDGGATWARRSRYYTSNFGVAILHPDQHFHLWAPDGSTLYVGNDGGIYATSDGGATFRDLNKGIVSMQFYSVCQTPAAPSQVGGGSQDNGTSLTRNGSLWFQVVGGDGSECAMHATNPDVFVASVFGGFFYRSLDGGKSFLRTEITPEAGDSSERTSFLRSNPADPMHLYTATNLRLYDSPDAGATWSPRSALVPGALLIRDFSFFPGDPARVVMGINGGQVFTSTDGGSTFRLAGTAPVAGISSVRFDGTDPNRLFVTSLLPDAGLERVFASTNGGATWNAISRTGRPNGLPDVPVDQLEQDPRYRSVLYVRNAVGIYRTVDGGLSWRRFGIGLPNVWPQQMAILPDGSKMRLATFGRGIWEIALAELPPDQPPTAQIDVPASTPTLDAGIPATFHGIAADPDADDILTTSWDFGDGSTGSGAGVVHAFAVPGSYVVTFRVTDPRELFAEARRTVNVRVPQGSVATGPELLLPVVLDVVGAGGAHYTTELTLISRAAAPTTVLLQYAASVGGGSGYASVTLQPGEVRIVPDAIAFLAAAGLPLPAAGTRIGTLRAVYPAAAPGDVFIGGRTSTPGAGGTFGLFYTGAATSTASATIFGLQQNSAQRSNVALVNAGPDPITLRVQLQGPNGEALGGPPDQELAGYGWTQLNQPLLGRAESGRAVVTKLSGASPFTAYGVLNDAVTSDGSFVPALVPGDATGADRLVPIVLSAAGYRTELTLTNFTSQPMPLTLTYTGSPQLSAAGSGAAPLTLQPGEQRILPDSMAFLRNLGLQIPSSGNVGGALLVRAPAGTPASSLAVGARTFTNAPGGGTFGLFYAGLTAGESATGLAYVNGLQQNAVQRSNLAVVNRGDASDSISLRVTYFGADGAALADPDAAVLAPGEWKQFNQPLAARGASAGYAKIERLSGASRFVAYGILNDQHNSDGSYIPMSR